jgi:hypothetical protein
MKKAPGWDQAPWLELLDVKKFALSGYRGVDAHENGRKVRADRLHADDDDDGAQKAAVTSARWRASKLLLIWVVGQSEITWPEATPVFSRVINTSTMRVRAK